MHTNMKSHRGYQVIKPTLDGIGMFRGVIKLICFNIEDEPQKAHEAKVAFYTALKQRRDRNQVYQTKFLNILQAI